MKYVQFTYVDAQTGIPLSEAPAANGPSIPEGIIPTFDIESSRIQQVPIVYGFIPSDYEGTIPSFVREIDEESFFITFKNELKERARNKRKYVEQAGIEVNDQFIATSIGDQNRVASMVTTLINDPEMESIDFEYSPNNWITIPREFGLNVGKAVGRHVQSCFSWCRNIHQQIDDMEIDIDSLENALPILQEITSFGAQEDFYPEENPEED